MPANYTTLVLCVPCTQLDMDVLPRLMGGVSYEVRARDPGMSRAFGAWANRLRESLDEADLAAVDGHTSVVYVVDEPRARSQSVDSALRFLKLGADLLRHGGLALKVESSGTAWSSAKWGALCERVSDASRQQANSQLAYWTGLIEAYVQLPIVGADAIYTCGMHLLGARDVSIDRESATRAFGDDIVQVAILLDMFTYYSRAEAKPSAIRDGQTFATAQGAPRFRLRGVPSTRHADDSLFKNPHGYWHLTLD